MTTPHTPGGIGAEELMWNPPTTICPNCGKKAYCNYSSIADYGSVLVSTLYGVCKDCADRHKYPKP